MDDYRENIISSLFMLDIFFCYFNVRKQNGACFVLRICPHQDLTWSLQFPMGLTPYNVYVVQNCNLEPQSSITLPSSNKTPQIYNFIPLKYRYFVGRPHTRLRLQFLFGWWWGCYGKREVFFFGHGNVSCFILLQAAFQQIEWWGQLLNPPSLSYNHWIYTGLNSQSYIGLFTVLFEMIDYLIGV